MKKYLLTLIASVLLPLASYALNYTKVSVAFNSDTSSWVRNYNLGTQALLIPSKEAVADYLTNLDKNKSYECDVKDYVTSAGSPISSQLYDIKNCIEK